MGKRGFWRPTITSLGDLIELIQQANTVRVYPSRKYPGITMIKVRTGVEYTGQISDSDFHLLREALTPFDPTPDKKATNYIRRVQRFEVRRYLEYVITAIALYGWHPARQRGTAERTYLQAQEMYIDRQLFQPEAIERVEEIMVVMADPDGSEFGQRLAELLRRQEVGLDQLPMLASAPVALERRRAREAAARVSRHVGEPKEWIELGYLAWDDCRLVEGNDGYPVKLYRLHDDQGNHYVCWMDRLSLDLPKHFSGKVQVLRHGEYLGLKETTILVVPAGITPIEICPACGGRYDQAACSCISEPVDIEAIIGEYDIEIMGDK